MEEVVDVRTNNNARIIRPKKKINRKTKKQIIFNAEARREFLTGFHKRKLQRKKKAQDELKIQLKDEKKRIRDEARNLHKTMVLSHRPIPELEELLATSERTLDFPEHSVSVKELSKVEPKDASADETDQEEDASGAQNCKDIKKAMRQLAARQHRKSKVVQAKSKLDRNKNKKQSRIKQLKKNAAVSKRTKHRGRRQTLRKE